MFSGEKRLTTMHPIVCNDAKIRRLEMHKKLLNINNYTQHHPCIQLTAWRYRTIIVVLWTHLATEKLRCSTTWSSTNEQKQCSHISKNTLTICNICQCQKHNCGMQVVKETNHSKTMVQCSCLYYYNQHCQQLKHGPQFGFSERHKASTFFIVIDWLLKPRCSTPIQVGAAATISTDFQKSIQRHKQTPASKSYPLKIRRHAQKFIHCKHNLATSPFNKA